MKSYQNFNLLVCIFSRLCYFYCFLTRSFMNNSFSSQKLNVLYLILCCILRFVLNIYIFLYYVRCHKITGLFFSFFKFLLYFHLKEYYLYIELMYMCMALMPNPVLLWATWPVTWTINYFHLNYFHFHSFIQGYQILFFKAQGDDILIHKPTKYKIINITIPNKIFILYAYV